jgi:signal peptidase I
MKKLILALTLSATLLLNTTTSYANSKYYYIKGTVKNYKYTITYNDGTTYTNEGIEIHDHNGNIWIWEGDYNKTTDGSFKDGQKVIVKMDKHGTKMQDDDIIKSIKKI